LVEKLEEQAKFLEGKGVFESSQISFLTTALDIDMEGIKQKRMK